MPKNWKSTTAFFSFLILNGYAIYSGRDSEIVGITSWVAFWSSIFMMLRNELTPVLIEKLIDAIKDKK